MNEQYFREGVKTSDMDDESNEEEKNLVENSDQPSAQTPTMAALVQHTPMGAGTVPTEDPIGETVVHEDSLGETIPFDAPRSETAVSGIPAVPGTGSLLAFLEPDEMERLRKRWNEIQGTFVDEPRSAVQQADALVSDVIEKITQVVSNQHSSLESQWKQGTDVSTEDLRKVLQSYRTFFNRLVV